MNEPQGYIIVLTGNGKGKTTSALGMAMRAAGQGLKVIMLQFLKGAWRYGEIHAAERLKPDFVLCPLGAGFVHVNPENPDHSDVRMTLEAWKTCRESLFSGNYDMVILDEINNAIGYGLLPIEEVLRALGEKPPAVHVVLTGREADPRIIEVADLVTEFVELKHPYSKGAPARKGIEF